MNWERLIDSLLFGLLVGTAFAILEKKGFEAKRPIRKFRAELNQLPTDESA